MANEPTPTTVPAAADFFVRTDIRFEDSPELGVHDRWTNVLILCPFVRGRPIYADFSQDFAQIYAKGTHDEVFGATELICLRWRFFLVLKGWGIGMTHINDYEIQASWAWMRRMTDKLDHMEEFKKRGGRGKPDAVRHVWQH